MIVQSEAKCEPQRPVAYNDARFNQILSGQKEINDLLRELRQITTSKIDDIAGEIPKDAVAQGISSAPEAWLDKVLYEQAKTTSMLRETLSRMADF